MNSDTHTLTYTHQLNYLDIFRVLPDVVRVETFEFQNCECPGNGVTCSYDSDVLYNNGVKVKRLPRPANEAAIIDDSDP